MVPETQVLFLRQPVWGWLGLTASLDRQGPGDDVRWGGALPQVGVRICSGAALPAEGAKGAGVRRRRKARSLRRSLGHGSGGPPSIGEEAAPWNQGTGGPETPTHRGYRKYEDGGEGLRLRGKRIVHLELPSGDREAQGLEQPAPRRRSEQGLDGVWVQGCNAGGGSGGARGEVGRPPLLYSPRWKPAPGSWMTPPPPHFPRPMYHRM